MSKSGFGKEPALPYKFSKKDWEEVTHKIEKTLSEEVADDFSKDWLKGLHHKEKSYLGFAGLPKSEDWIL